MYSTEYSPVYGNAHRWHRLFSVLDACFDYIIFYSYIIISACCFFFILEYFRSHKFSAFTRVLVAIVAFAQTVNSHECVCVCVFVSNQMICACGFVLINGTNISNRFLLFTLYKHVFHVIWTAFSPGEIFDIHRTHFASVCSTISTKRLSVDRSSEIQTKTRDHRKRGLAWNFIWWCWILKMTRAQSHVSDDIHLKWITTFSKRSID